MALDRACSPGMDIMPAKGRLVRREPEAQGK